MSQRPSGRAPACFQRYKVTCLLPHSGSALCVFLTAGVTRRRLCYKATTVVEVYAHVSSGQPGHPVIC